jgi:hypothetical protein
VKSIPQTVYIVVNENDYPINTTRVYLSPSQAKALVTNRMNNAKYWKEHSERYKDTNEYNHKQWELNKDKPLPTYRILVGTINWEEFVP